VSDIHKSEPNKITTKQPGSGSGFGFGSCTDLGYAISLNYNDRNFIIENNILKAKDELLCTEYTNIGKLLLDRMKAKPDFVGQARHCMKLSDAKIVFAEENSINTILEAAKLNNSDIKVVVLGESSNALTFSKIINGHQKSEVENFKCTPIDNIHDTAAILYSSGTTGPLKAILISHYSILSNALLPGGFNVEGIPLWFSGYFWVSGVALTLSCTVNYCKKLFYPKFYEEMTCKIIEKYKVTWIFLGPSMVNRILKSGYFKKYDVSSIKKIVIGGTSFSSESEIRLKECLPNADIIQHYGMTELYVMATVAKSNHKAGSVGTVIKNAQIKIIDTETGITLGPNNTGEILAKTSTMMKGYFNNPQATKDAIDPDGWLHTGDLGYYDEDGEIFFIDRLKETIKYRSHLVSPWEIERLLLTHPKIVDVAVVSVPHLEDDEHPIAFVTKVPGSKITERELQELVETNMTEKYHLRAGVKFIENMPYTASGKISRKDLKIMAKSYQTN
ncbi:hypothetical protein M0802_013600, partial [Mischocyttarus mexicanus]